MRHILPAGIREKILVFFLLLFTLSGLGIVWREQNLLESQYRQLRSHEIGNEIALSREALQALVSRLRGAGSTAANWQESRQALASHAKDPQQRKYLSGQWETLRQIWPELEIIRLTDLREQAIWEESGWQGLGALSLSDGQLAPAHRQALRKEAPQTGIDCSDDCLLMVWVPVLHNGRAVGTVMLGARLEAVLSFFSRITTSEIGLVRHRPRSEDGKESAISQQILAMTGGVTTRQRLNQLDLNWEPLADLPAVWQQQVIEQHHYDVVRWPMALDGWVAPVDFLTIEDVDSAYRQKRREITRSALGALLVTLLFGGVAMVIAHGFVRRIGILTGAIAAVGSRRFDEAGQILASRIHRLQFDDELDQAIRTSHQVTHELQAREEESARHQQQMADMLHDLEHERSLIRHLLDTAPLIILVHDGAEHIDLINRYAIRLLGLPEELNQPPLNAFFEEDERFPALRHVPLGQVVQNDGRLATIDNRYLEIAWLHCGFDAPQLGQRVLSIGQDMTALNHAEAERIRLNMQLLRAQKMEAIGQLAGGIAHDFNNILASMLGFTALAREFHATDPESKLAFYLEQVTRSGERARDTIAQLLAYSRGSNDDSVRLELPELVRDITRLVEPLIPSSIRIQLDLHPVAPVLFNPGKLHQVLMNLLINARDAMPKGGLITLRLYQANVSEKNACASCHAHFPGPWVVLHVEDSGCGITESMLNSIFDPFFTTKDAGKGTGMGLSVVHGLVHAAQGHIHLSSQPGQGTAFRLYFPPLPQEA